MAAEREHLVFLAKLAEQAERYDEMEDAMSLMLKSEIHLTVEERRLFYRGYYGVIHSHTSSWHAISDYHKTDIVDFPCVMKAYCQKLERKIFTAYNKAMSMIEQDLNLSVMLEELIFFHRIKRKFQDLTSKIVPKTTEFLNDFSIDIDVDSMDREHVVFLAKLADKADRYDDMTKAMKKACFINSELSPEERDLVFNSFINLANKMLASRHKLPCRKKERMTRRLIFLVGGKSKRRNEEITEEYCLRIEQELSDVCYQVLCLIDEFLLPAANNYEALTFYYKMKGDFYRCLAEFKFDSEKEELINKSLKGYQKATNLADLHLAASHRIRLDLALSYGIFYHDTVEDFEMACEVTGATYEVAKTELGLMKLNGVVAKEEINTFVKEIEKYLVNWEYQIDVMENRDYMETITAPSPQSSPRRRTGLSTRTEQRITVSSIVKRKRRRHQNNESRPLKVSPARFFNRNSRRILLPCLALDLHLFGCSTTLCRSTRRRTELLVDMDMDMIVSMQNICIIWTG